MKFKEFEITGKKFSVNRSSIQEKYKVWTYIFRHGSDTYYIKARKLSTAKERLKRMLKVYNR